MALRYRLVVITHGHGETLDDTLATFHEMVTPRPTYQTIFQDYESLGFCRSVRNAWADAAADDSYEYVFWLEHDFRFMCPLELGPLAGVLEERHDLTQLSLVRDAVNEDEKAAGGWYQFHRASLTHHPEWLEHRICHTTNPSLMRRQFMQENPWPSYERYCEGLFSGDLRERGYSFGTWGHGEVYVRHTGALRTGHSY